MSLIEQLRKFSEAADGLSDEIPQEELERLTANIKDHIDDLLQYIDVIEADSSRLKDLAKRYGEVAKVQENKAARIKDHVKFALKSQGFTKFSTDIHRISLSTTQRVVPRRPPTLDDAWQNPTLVIPKLRWKSDPPLTIVDEHPDLVEFEYSWDLDKLKESGNEALLEIKTTDRLTVGIAKK